MSHELTGLVPVSLTRRRMIAGAAALGAATVVGTGIARAQDSTATPGIKDGGDTTNTSEATDRATQSAERYQDFVSKLASNLGLAGATGVDTAIRDALKGMIDDQLAAGEIAANNATAWKTEIDESVAPLKIGSPGAGGHRGGGRGPGSGDQSDHLAPGSGSDAEDNVNDPSATPGVTGASVTSATLV